MSWVSGCRRCGRQAGWRQVQVGCGAALEPPLDPRWGSVASGQAASLNSCPRTSSILFYYIPPLDPPEGLLNLDPDFLCACVGGGAGALHVCNRRQAARMWAESIAFLPYWSTGFMDLRIDKGGRRPLLATILD